jgi:hypothetical protein
MVSGAHRPPINFSTLRQLNKSLQCCDHFPANRWCAPENIWAKYMGREALHRSVGARGEHNPDERCAIGDVTTAGAAFGVSTPPAENSPVYYYHTNQYATASLIPRLPAGICRRAKLSSERLVQDAGQERSSWIDAEGQRLEQHFFQYRYPPDLCLCE